MPFIIHSLGDHMYGLWIFVGSFLGYYGLMDFGLNSAVQRFISKAVGTNDIEEENRICNTALGVFTVIGGFALIMSFVVAFIVPLLVVNITEVSLFRKLILILGINFSIGFPLRVFAGILAANIRFELSSMVDLSKLAIRTLLIYIFLLDGYGVIALAVITATLDIYAYSVKYFIVRKLYKHIVLSSRYFDKSRIRTLFGYSVYTFVAQVADQLRFNIDNLVITVFIGLSSVTPYSIGARFIAYFSEFISAATGMLAPVFSQYHAAEQYDLLKEKYLFMTKINGYLSFLVGGLLAIFSREFIIRWAGPEYLVSYSVILVLLIPRIFALMQVPSIQMLFGISKHKFFTVSNSIEGILNLIASVVLVKYYGILGVALGTAIPMITVKLFIQPIYTCKAIRLKVSYYYLNVLLPVMIKSMLIITVLWIVLRRFVTPDYTRIMVLAVSALAVFVITAFFIGFNKNERDYFRSVARMYFIFTRHGN
ncbi:MAG: hypothetical protein A2339_01575 [Elusimicrobia bacterium RIFOXYB12_FULL_50_12]|nr:MAG: hypothetical protein A2339_01575 [Elusimicrobia bacterium RIFOXYB12_FULL_50_12]